MSLIQSSGHDKRSNQLMTSTPERILRANDREFNAQFKYNVSVC